MIAAARAILKALAEHARGVEYAKLEQYMGEIVETRKQYIDFDSILSSFWTLSPLICQRLPRHDVPRAPGGVLYLAPMPSRC